MSDRGKKAVQIGAPAEDPQKKEGEKRAKDAEVKLSEEDERIKEQVELLVTRSADNNPGIAKIAVEQLVELLRTSSGSVASVPKPLKYVRSLYPELEHALKASQDAALIRRLHDVLSFVAMTLELEDVRRVTLDHKLQGTQDDLAQWGHEYLRFLAGGIAGEWAERKGEDNSYLNGFVNQIVQYMIAHQDEPTAVDLLIEIDGIDRIVAYVDETNYKRIASYTAAMSKYLTRPVDTAVLGVVFDIYVKMSAFTEAMVIALQLTDQEKVSSLFTACPEKAVRLQMALECARNKVFIEFDNEEDELLQEANGNMRLSQLYRYAAGELDSLAPKSPEEIFKNSDSKAAASDGYRYGLACTFVSGLVNCGYGKDKYLTEFETLVFEQREDHIISTIAALGLLHLWDHTEGLQELDKYLYSESPFVKAGACLAIGITMCGVNNPFDPALGLLSEYVNSPQKEVGIGAILGIGYAYAGTRRVDVKELLIPILADADKPLEVQCMTAYALSMVFVGSADGDISETMLTCLIDIPDVNVTDTCVRYLILALGCMFLGCQESAETLLDATQALSPLIQRYTDVVVRSCAFAATGNVVVIQNFFHVIAESSDAAEDEEKDDEDEQKPEDKEKQQPLNYKAVAVLGIGLVAVGESLGTEMTKRAIIHMLLADTVSKGENPMSGRRAVPLVYALLSAATPNMAVVETLNRLAHDSDLATASNAILALGLVSAGSNNARAAGKLRSLSSYYQKEKYAPILFVVRLAQGLCAMGKGHLSLSVLQHDRTFVSPTALMGVLSVLHSALELDKTILDKYHYMLFGLTGSINPRMVIPVNEEMEPINGLQVRVGLPVDTVAVAGKPKTITGFQTQTTPVLLSSTDKVELADSQYRAVPSVMEGIFVVEKKPVVE